MHKLNNSKIVAWLDWSELPSYAPDISVELHNNEQTYKNIKIMNLKGQ